MRFGSLLAPRAPEPPAFDELLERRLQLARHNSKWTELEAVDLVERGPFLVAASDDAVYVRFRADPDHNETVPLYFTVTDGRVSLYERQPWTWSEHVERQARRAR